MFWIFRFTGFLLLTHLLQEQCSLCFKNSPAKSRHLYFAPMVSSKFYVKTYDTFSVCFINHIRTVSIFIICMWLSKWPSNNHSNDCLLFSYSVTFYPLSKFSWVGLCEPKYLFVLYLSVLLLVPTCPDHFNFISLEVR